MTKCHVLIIEDEWLIADHLAYLAELAGATSIATASTEDEAVASAQERKPAIIISDVILRSGGGPRAVQRIAMLCGKVPAVFVTGTPETCEPDDIVITKPFDEAFLVETLRDMTRNMQTPTFPFGVSPR